MIEYIVYWLMNKIGYRRIYYDAAFSRGIQLESYSVWLFKPEWKKGTYRELNFVSGFEYCGYGVDK